ncbi:MAG: hypothetical protein A3F90_04170 [Deltaproteobacteria bacterium RIFCSPLOWO2_12_FULL_60_19]|nr:MAG: hypothetical protein A3F90_04170 [Deltaproteobacteria bacterium RIFCSPLOWO2_12_FULL_60_19]
MADIKERMIRAARLDASLYEEVEADQDALGQAAVVVLLSSVAGGIGSLVHGGLSGLVLGVVASLIAWYLWAYITYLVGAKLFPEPQTHADMGQLLRTTGFASSPGLIRVLGIIPGLTGIAFFVALVWMLIAMVIAVRQALDYNSTLRAVGVCAVGWVALIAVLYLLGLGASL